MVRLISRSSFSSGRSASTFLFRTSASRTRWDRWDILSSLNRIVFYRLLYDLSYLDPDEQKALFSFSYFCIPQSAIRNPQLQYYPSLFRELLLRELEHFAVVHMAFCYLVLVGGKQLLYLVVELVLRQHVRGYHLGDIRGYGVTGRVVFGQTLGLKVRGDRIGNMLDHFFWKTHGNSLPVL